MPWKIIQFFNNNYWVSVILPISSSNATSELDSDKYFQSLDGFMSGLSFGNPRVKGLYTFLHGGPGAAAHEHRWKLLVLTILIISPFQKLEILEPAKIFSGLIFTQPSWIVRMYPNVPECTNVLVCTRILSKKILLCCCTLLFYFHKWFIISQIFIVI